MKYQGRKISLSIEGESHSKSMVMTLFGLPKLDTDLLGLADFLARRKGVIGYSAPRPEEDIPTLEYDNGIYRAVLFNKNIRPADYSELYAKPRPSHADYALFLKDGSLSNEGGGRFSGRLTAPLCVAGFLAKQFLLQYGVEIYSAITQIGDCTAFLPSASQNDYKKALSGFPAFYNIDSFSDILKTAAQKGDSLGGKVQCSVFGFPKGKGDAFTDGIESRISPLVFAIPAVKGVEFGLGFGFAQTLGSVANDCLSVKNGVISFDSNNSGGINGGISNGEPIVIGVAFRPTPSISKVQNTVDLLTMQNTQIQIKGRHDSCIVPRALPAVESAVALALADLLLEEQ